MQFSSPIVANGRRGERAEARHHPRRVAPPREARRRRGRYTRRTTVRISATDPTGRGTSGGGARAATTAATNDGETSVEESSTHG
jgi:hypothetical protein